MFGVDTPAQTFLWKVLNDVIDFRKKHLKDPTEIRMSEPDWNQVVRASYHYPARDDDDPEHPLSDEKIYGDPETAGDEGLLFGCRALKDTCVEVGSVVIS